MMQGALVLSILLQLVATRRALRLVAVTSRRTAPLLLAAPTAAMASRGVLVLWHEVAAPGSTDRLLELPVLLVSVLMLAGVAALEPLLRSMTTLNLALSDSEQRLEGVIGALAEGVVVRDQQGIIRTCNASAERLLGRTRDQIIGAPAIDVEDGAPTFPEEARAALIALHTGEPITGMAAQARREDGTLMWLSINTRPLMWPGQARPAGIVPSFTDVSESKHTERVLRDVTEGAASRTGEAFFEFLVERLACDLGMACVLVAEVTPERPDGARTRALWRDGALACAVEFTLAHSPCDVQAHFPVVHERGTRAAFPHDRLVASMGIESYCGVPLFGATGALLGLLAVLDRKPIAEPHRVQATVQIFAVRAAAELAHDRAERRLEEQRAFLRQVVDTSPNHVMARDRSGHVTLINAACAEWHQVGVEQATGLPFSALEPNSETVERYLREDLEVLDCGRELVTPEELLASRSGGMRWLESVKRPIVGRGGHAEQVLIVSTDITERKHAEEALRRAEETYRGIVDNAAEGFFRLTRSGTLATANPAFARMLGYESVTEVLERADAPDLLARHFEPACLSAIERRLAGDEPRRFVHRLQRVDGTTLWVSHHARCVRDASGEIEAYDGTLHDVTQRVLADEAQAELHDKLGKAAHEWQTTFDAIQAPVLVVDLRGAVQRMNRAAQQLVGRDFQDNLGRAVADFGPGEPWQTAAAMVRRVSAELPSSSVQVREALTGTTWDIAASVAGSGPRREERVILVARDISAVIALQESLRRSETMSAMGSLVAGVAHQVRNPLFGISSTIDAFEARFDGDQTFSQYMSVLRGELERLTSLMQELLEYGRPPSHERESTPLADVIAQAVRSCQAMARHARVTLVSEVADDAGIVAIDRRRVLQVFQNLVENALQHSTPGEKVVISGRKVWVREQAWFECAVLDNGPGFLPGDLPRLFDPFFTRRRGGTGLGLSIAQRIVDEHSGCIIAANRPDGGALMRVRLPLVQE